MFGLPNTTAGHSPSPGTSFSALSTATSSPSSSSAPVIFGQSPHSSSVIVPSPGFPVTIFSQPQIPAISATCLEQNNPPNASSSSPSGATLTSLIAATLATSLAAQQQRNQQQQQALSILNNAAAMAQQQQQIAAAQNLFSEFFLLRSQQNAAPQLPPTMPLPFPNNCNPIQTASDQPNNQSALLNSVQQQKTAIDIIQKALEAIAVANQQQQPPKLTNGIGVSSPPPSSLLGANPPANGVPSNLYVHLQQNGVALSQQPSTTAILQQQNAQLEQQLLALFANNQQQQSPPPNQQNGLLKANANLSASLFQASAASFQHPSNNVQMNSISSALSGNGEQPLDLSQRAALFESSSSLINIPSGGNHPSQQRKNCEIRRSASSVSYYKKSNADVSEHFQRTFSGKWPKRQPSFRHNPAIGGRASKSSIGTKEGSIGETVIEGESEGRDSPMDEGNRASAEPQKNVEVVQMVEEQQRPPSRPKSRLQHRLGYTLIKKIFTSSDDKQVEEHFRKSLGDDRFKQIRNAQQKQQQENNNVDKMEANSPKP